MPGVILFGEVIHSTEEIDDFSSGAGAGAAVRTVTENARTLKFSNQSFEKDDTLTRNLHLLLEPKRE